MGAIISGLVAKFRSYGLINWFMGLKQPVVLGSSHKGALDEIEAFIFDCDGVLYHHSKTIPGSTAFIEKLRNLNKKCYFVTNASGKSRKTLAQRLQELGFGNVDPDHCISASSAAADYLKMRHPSCKNVYFVGLSGVHEELTLAGFNCLGTDEEGGSLSLIKEKFVDEGLDQVSAVVVGHLDENMSYARLAKAVVYARNKDRPYIGTNLDQSWFIDHSLSDGEDLAEGSNQIVRLPAGGAVVNYVSYAAERQPDAIVGKPSPDLAKLVIEKYGLNPKSTLMVGDRLNTDIAFGKEAGFKTLLVLSGCHGMQDVEKVDSINKPDFIAQCLGDIVEVLNK